MNHAIIIVGFGQIHNGVEFYHIKNSWRKSWGHGGFGKIATNLIKPGYYVGNTGYVDELFWTGTWLKNLQEKFDEVKLSYHERRCNTELFDNDFMESFDGRDAYDFCLKYHHMILLVQDIVKNSRYYFGHH